MVQFIFDRIIIIIIIITLYDQMLMFAKRTILHIEKIF